MIDSQLPTLTPTPTPLNLFYSEPEPEPDPGSLTIWDHSSHHDYHQHHHLSPSNQGFSDFNIDTQGNCDHDHIDSSIPIGLEDQGIDRSSSGFCQGVGLGLGLGIGVGAGIEDYSQFPSVEYQFGIRDEEEEDFIPLLADTTVFYDNIPINTNISSDISLPVYQPSNLYSPITQFAQAEYTLFAPNPDPEPCLSVQFDNDPAPTEIEREHDHVQAHAHTQENRSSAIQLDQLIASPTGLWSPVTSVSLLPSHELDYLYGHQLESQFQSQSQSQLRGPPITPYYQDHTPTLAPHCPDYDLDLDLAEFYSDMTKDRSLPFPSSVFDRSSHITNHGYRE